MHGNAAAEVIKHSERSKESVEITQEASNMTTAKIFSLCFLITLCCSEIVTSSLLKVKRFFVTLYRLYSERVLFRWSTWSI